MAQTVVATLHNLSKQGKTILATIHQPSSEVYQMFDKYVVIFKLVGLYYFDLNNLILSFTLILNILIIIPNITIILNRNLNLTIILIISQIHIRDRILVRLRRETRLYKSGKKTSFPSQLFRSVNFPVQTDGKVRREFCLDEKLVLNSHSDG
jgi:ABC-type multidrug transport system ATPase subunit